ncbi:MAG TPA: multicopper oxidase domain-containing protein [Polyangiaceae bacterium]|nr:multicopper oxidase domain-containing protein [Polyangiaceae bacterium]
MGATAAACGSSRPAEPTGEGRQASVTTPQTALDGSTVPQFVEALPTLQGQRVDGTATVRVDMREFQQKVLPAQFYPRRGQFAAGTFLWGYALNGGNPSWPGRTIESRQGVSTSVIYTNSLQQANGSPPVLQQFMTQDLTLHWSDPIGASAKNHCIVGDENGGDTFTPANEEATNDAGVIGGTQNAVPVACQVPYAGPVPTVPHLHGAEVLSAYDGHPDAWFTPGQAQKGRGFVSSTYNYPNQQEATTLWFHDHALGTTRLNVFSGLAAFYLIRDARDTGASNNPITLPGGAFEQEILVADRSFDKSGQLLFPDGSGANNPQGFNGFNGPPGNPNLHPFTIPEYFGDVMTVNGKSWPFFEVQPRRYRLRFVNASNARFLRMQLFAEAKTGGNFNGIATLFTDPAGVGTPGPNLWQIGSDGGFLNAPTNVDAGQSAPHLFMAPAERADVIVDFAGQSGKRFVLTNTAVAPFPNGGATVEPLPPPALQGPSPQSPNGLGPYDVVDQVMEFRVDVPLQGTDASFNPAGGHPALRATPIVDIKPADTNLRVDVHRQLVLDEVEDVNTGAPVEVIVNNSHWNGRREGTTTVIAGSTSNGDGLQATETPREGATELWEIANMTPDAHPIHIHLVQFQVINVQPFNTEADLCPYTGQGNFDFSGPQYRAAWDALFPGGTFNGFTFPKGTFTPGFGPPLDYGTPNADGAIGGNLAFSTGNSQYFVGPAVPPDPRDAGWKDTFKMFPCAVTRLAVRWAPQDAAAGSTHAGQNPFPFDPTTGGPGYVWHCHILDHEDNEMMRPILLAK